MSETAHRTSAFIFKTTKRLRFENPANGDQLMVEIMDTPERFAWCLQVNNNRSYVVLRNDNILKFQDYYVAPLHWDARFPVFTPFQIKVMKEK